MEKKHKAPQMPKNRPRKDKFVDRTWRKAALYDKHRSRPVRRNESHSSSNCSDLEAETAFKVNINAGRTSTRSQAPRKVFNRGSKSGSPVGRLLRARRTGKINGKLASSLCSSYKIYRGYWPSPRDYYCGSENYSSDSSCNSSCSEEINTSSHISYHESYDKPNLLVMDSLHASKNTSHENDRAFALHRRKRLNNHSPHPLRNQYCHGYLKNEDSSVIECEENHLSLSQKYRPESFKDFIGQKIVRKSLMNAILKQKIAPIYLFHGPRGTGKTSAARIFASALNCLSPNRKSKPCCKCRECWLFLSGKSPRVTELNAGGNDGIEKLKFCLETLQVSYLGSGYRIFIIEDCHELTPEAWSSAFLKCMEHPIGYVVFILITVDLEWVPKTAQSRCQKFCFQKLRDVDMLNRLKMIAVAENIEIEEDALHLITARAGGSLWDAETALEQFSLLASRVTVSRVRQMIGLIPNEKLLDLLDFALSADTVNTVKCTREITDSGVKPLALVSQLATLVMDILANSSFSAEAQESKNFFGCPYSSKDRTEKLGRALKILAEAEKQLRASNECISWLTAALLQLGPDELNPNPHPAADTSMIHTNITLHNLNQRKMTEMNPTYAEEICHHIDHWNVYEVPHKIISPANPEEIEAKDSGTADSLEIGCGSAETLTSPFCNLHMTKPVHSHDTKTNSFPVPSASTNCTIEGGKLNLNPMSPGKVEEIWQRVLKSSQSTTLEDLLQGQGKLVTLLVCKENAGAIAHVELSHHQQKVKLERLEISISNALQEALGCPVEVKMILVPSSCEHNISEVTNVFPHNPKDTLYCEENKLKTSTTKLMRCVLVLVRKLRKWRRELGFQFKCVPCLKSSCMCLSARRRLCLEC